MSFDTTSYDSGFKGLRYYDRSDLVESMNELEEDEPYLVTIEKNSFLETIEDNLIKVTDGTGNKIKAITLDDIRRILDDNIDDWGE